MAKAHAIRAINAVFKQFSDRLQGLPPSDLSRPTIMKNDLGNLSRMNILHSNQRFILNLFQSCVNAINTDIDISIVLTLSKFGQRDQRWFDFTKLVDTYGVKDVSYHAACNVHSSDPSIDLIWSRFGLQEVVGQRVTLFPVYCMMETANFQSNLDHLTIDVDRRLLDVVRLDKSKINFLQLYAVTPHCHSTAPAKHPVSRVITMCDMHIDWHRKMINANANRYVEHMEDLARKTVTGSYVRLEYVFLVGPHFDTLIQPSDFFTQPMISQLLETVPMLVPFRNTDGSGLSSVVNSVSTYLSGALHDVLHQARGLGGYENSWSAFQLELACEELFFGRPLCRSSRQFSAALGVSATSQNSFTRMRGFLCFGPIGGASVGESPPPIDIWTKDEVQKTRVLRLFPLTDSMLAGPQIIGEHLVRILICDLHQRDIGMPVESLRGRTLQFGRLVDCRSVSEFAREIVGRNAFGYPLTFGRAVQMVTAMSFDPAHCLTLDLAGYRFFPSIKYWDEHRHLKAKWNFKDYIELHHPHEIPSAAARAASYLGDVCSKIDELGLSYARNLVKYRENGMPWLEKCVERLPRGMPKERAITALAFLSSVGLIQNGDFVSFNKLAELERALPVTQRHLQDLQVLSKLLLLQNPAVWRFHESVP
ncbi:unnamed protein product [Leuciscus chuanchicus]